MEPIYPQVPHLEVKVGEWYLALNHHNRIYAHRCSHLARHNRLPIMGKSFKASVSYVRIWGPLPKDEYQCPTCGGIHETYVQCPSLPKPGPKKRRNRDPHEIALDLVNKCGGFEQARDLIHRLEMCVGMTPNELKEVTL